MVSFQRISIHAPQTRCDDIKSSIRYRSHSFQSTHLKRGATDLLKRQDVIDLFQSTHLKRGATSGADLAGRLYIFQSTHLKRGATRAGAQGHHTANFNPRTSNEVRPQDLNSYAEVKISIHAPQTRCDIPNINLADTFFYFNPRTSNEVRRCWSFELLYEVYFNPRTSNEVRQKHS